MKITRVSTAVVEGNFDWTFVRVEWDNGVRGLGECFFAPGLTYMLSWTAGAREGAGAAVDIAIDCHWRVSLKDARLIATECEPFRLMWRRNPLPPWATNEFRELRLAWATPNIPGENLYLFEGFRSLFEGQCVSVLALDLQKAGGLGEARRAAEYADSFTMPVAPHNISSPIGTIASAYFSTSIPNFLALEHHARVRFPSRTYWQALPAR